MRWERRSGFVSFAPHRATRATCRGGWLVYHVGDRLVLQRTPGCGGSRKEEAKVKEILLMPHGAPTCHDHRPGTPAGDVVVGTSTGDVFVLLLEEQWKEASTSKLVGGIHLVAENSPTGLKNRCMDVAWSPKGDGSFVVCHQDGSLHLFQKRGSSLGDGFQDDKSEGTLMRLGSYGRRGTVEQSNHMDRMQVCAAPIHALCFSPDGKALATACGDGVLRVWDLERRQLLYGFSSFYGAFLCCTWSNDGKYIAAGGEDDTVTIYSVMERTTVVWGEGHDSFVSAVAFDNWFVSPEATVVAGAPANVKTYRLASAGQDTKVCLWELRVQEDENGMDTLDQVVEVGDRIQPPPCRSDMCFLAPLCEHKLHQEPLSFVGFTEDALLTCCHGGQVRIWDRPPIEHARSPRSP
mmetsp:Transcript_7237/g.45209  ORF Transcript_7237/g.45209 Transcript_7237/m.45209 type:complete len:407 (+) Transcript_7237:3222-4442(+)